MKLPQRPMIISDASDNILTGTTGDATAALEIFLEIDSREKVFLPMLDPDSVRLAVQAGLGREIELEVSGKLNRIFSKPVKVRGRVSRINQGKAVVEGPVYQGVEFDVGRNVVLESNSINILLTERRFPGHDPALFKTGGLNPKEAKLVVVKSVNHAKANFAPLSKGYFVADSPGLSTLDPCNMPNRKITRPMFPLDPQAELGF